jgi:HlyD family secretion protein
MKRKCWLWLLPALAVAGGLAAMATAVGLRGQKPRPQAVPLSMPAAAPFKNYLSGAGIVESYGQNTAVAAATSGIVARVPVRVGQAVKRGEVLLQLDDRSARAEVKSQQEAVAAAQARWQDALASARELQLKAAFAKQAGAEAMSREEIATREAASQAAQAKADSQKAEIGSARAKLDEARLRLDLLTLHAPQDGEVLQLNARIGEFAAAGALVTPLVVVGDLSQLQVRVDIDEADAWRFQAKGAARLILRGQDKLQARLKFLHIEPLVAPKTALTGASTERVDTRVLRIVYAFERGDLPVFVGQQVDVYVEQGSSDDPPSK